MSTIDLIRFQSDAKMLTDLWADLMTGTYSTFFPPLKRDYWLRVFAKYQPTK